MRDSAPAESRGAGEEKTPAAVVRVVSRGNKGGAGVKLLMENALLVEQNTPDRLRPGPVDDPRITILDKRVIRTSSSSPSAQASCLKEPPRGAHRKAIML